MPAAVKLRTAHEGHPSGELEQHVVFRLVWYPQIGETSKVRFRAPVEVLTYNRNSFLRVRSNNRQQIHDGSPLSLPMSCEMNEQADNPASQPTC